MKKLTAVFLSVVLCCMICINTSATFNIDRIFVNANVMTAGTDVKGDDPISIDEGDRIFIIGWAFGENSNLKEIVYSIDGGEDVVCPDNYRDRADVAAAFGLDASFGEHAGFGHDTADQGGMLELAGIDTLGGGSYRLTIKAVYNDSTYESKDFNLQVGPTSVEPPDTDAYIVKYSFDTLYVNDLNNFLVNNGAAGIWIEENPINDKISAIRIRGWAYIGGGAIESFGYQIDDGPMVLDGSFVFDRPDVQAAFGVPSDVANGFDITFDTTNVDLGEHTVRVYVATADGQTLEFIEFNFTQALEPAPIVENNEEWLCGKDPVNTMTPNWWFNPVGEPDGRYVEFFFTAKNSFSGIHGFYYCSNPVATPDLGYAVMNVELIKNGEIVAVREIHGVGDNWVDTDFGDVYDPGEYSIRYSCSSGSGIENNCWCVIGGTQLGSGSVYYDSDGINISYPGAFPCIMLITVSSEEDDPIEIHTGPLTLYKNDTGYFVDSCERDAKGKITIPETVTVNGKEVPVNEIGGLAFSYCKEITGVTIPESITDIGWKAFCSCRGLKSVEIPKSVTMLVYATFENCSSLTDVVIPDSVTAIDEAVFNGCDNLKTVKYSGSEEQWNNVLISRGNEPLKNATIIFNYKGAVPGDCNGDGAIDNKDVVVLFRYASGFDKLDDESAYDFNGDKTVDNKDVVALFRYVSSKA